jgi:hypothetical protein
MKRTRIMLMAMVAAGLSACPPGAVNDEATEVAKQRINSTEQAKQRINAAPKGSVELAKQRINITTGRG